MKLSLDLLASALIITGARGGSGWVFQQARAATAHRSSVAEPQGRELES